MSSRIGFKATAIIAVLGVALSTFLAPAAVAAPVLPDPPPTAVTAVASLNKTASVTEISPGDTFTYTLTVGCSAITDLGCRDAVLTDVVPAPFVVVSAAVGPGANTAAEPVIAGNTVTVTWTSALGPNAVGILDATTGIVDITVRLPADVSSDLSGIEVLNDATLEGTNFTDVQDQVGVTPVIPLNVATTASKSLTPSSAIATPGTSVVAALGGTNTSNGAVDELIIQDPVDENAAPNPFEYLGFVGFGTVTPPAGAVGAPVYEVFDGTDWVLAPGGTLPAGLDAADVRGTRVSFTGDIPAGATAGVTVNLALTDAAAELPDRATVTNTVSSEVVAGEQRASAENAADFTVLQNDIQVAATKSFTPAPAVVVAGQTSTVVLGARNTSTIPLDSLSIREPSTGAFPAEYSFSGFTAPIAYPANAGLGTVIYHFAGGVSQPVEFDPNTIPAGPDPAQGAVEWFEVFFSGPIQPGGETSVTFTVDTDPDLSDLPRTVTNEVLVTGTNQGATGEATASDDLYIYDEVLETYISKQIRPSKILAAPGQVVTVTLNGGLTERPDPPTRENGTTGYAQQIVIQDPEDAPGSDAWWNAFDLTAITQTPIPTDAELTIEYFDTVSGTWKLLDGPISGIPIYSSVVPADITAVAGGVRFIYDYIGGDDGFAPGIDLAPNFTASLRADGRYIPGPPFASDSSTFIANCAQSSAASANNAVPDASSALSDAGPCPEIELVPPVPGGGDLIDKTFGTSSSGGLKSVIARSGDTIPSTLRWSTGGYSNLDTVQITDVAAPESTPVAGSVYDAFNLTRVQAITPATDPLIAYDQVNEVLLYNGSTWVRASADPCPAACRGTFPGVSLTSAEQGSTLSVRLIFAESTTRAAVSVGNLDAPPVGSGVARSFDNVRPITLVWQVRDARRSDGAAALGDIEYNLDGQNGVVRNTANATGNLAGGGTISANDQDDVVIVDVPITTSTSKTWSGGPVAVPPANSGILPSAYPITRMSVTTRNTTPARVDALQITDPAPGSASDPFDVFQFSGFVRIATPSGGVSADTRIDLYFEDGSTVTYTQSEALALNSGTLPGGRGEVIGFQARFSGRIASNAAGVVELDMRLRPTHRVGGAPVTVADGPVGNTAQGIVSDVDEPGTCPPPTPAPGERLPRYACDDDSATMALAEPSFGLDVTKSFDPDEQKEQPDGSIEPIVMTLTGQPTGSARAVTMLLADQDPAFWNAFDFVGMDPGWFLQGPIARVQACYSAGGEFTVVDGNVTVGDPTAGGCSDPGTLEDAAAFMNAAAAAGDVYAVSFQFASANGLGWSNPANPIQSVPLLVQRRETLRTGGPVPSTRSDQIAPPGQPAPGIFDNTAQGIALSVDITPGNPLQAEDDAEAQYRYLHLQNSISVTKTPNGDVRPGAEIPFALTFRNTGEKPITDPVFTDLLPMKNGVSQLVFYPDRDPSVSPYSFALTGPAPDPAVGSPLPTDPDDLTIAESFDRIVFTPPAGTVLGVGQTYTITVKLMLRPGVTQGEQVVNTARITGGEPFDDCVTTPAGVPTDVCEDTSTVTPLAVPALSTIKYVKADELHGQAGIPEVFSVANGYSCAGTATSDGFYRAPCVPVTLPGKTETWRFTITNAGTLPLDKVVAIDNLPIPGDQGLIAVLPRESQWEPTLVGGVRLVEGSAAGAALTTSYSTSSVPCIADLNPLGAPCAAGAWLPLAGADPTAVRSLKYAIAFPGGELLEPGESLTLEFQTRTTPTAWNPSAYPIAYNTVATGGSAVGTQPVVVPATEGRRVGVSYPTGPISLQKTVTGDGAGYAPSSFPVTLTCTSDGQSVTGLPNVTLVPDAAPTVVNGLPWGAECSAIEGENGQSDQNIGTAIVGGPNDPIGLVSVENIFETTGFTVSKEVDAGGAVDQDGEPIDYTDVFTFEASCTFLGEEVVPEADREFELTDGDEKKFEDLPVGADCTVTETDAGSAASVSVNGVDADTFDFTLQAGEQERVTAAFVNHYTVGAIQITKSVTGSGADAWGNGEFEVQLVCTLPAADPETVFSDTRLLSKTDPIWRVDNLPSGATCAVEELDDAGATDSSVDPDGVVTVGVAGQEGAVALVTITNDFRTGGLQIIKQVDGPGSPTLSNGPFLFTVRCTYEGEVVLNRAPTLTGDGTGDPLVSIEFTGIPVGAVCVVTEVIDGGADETPPPKTIVIRDEVDGVPTISEVGFLNVFSAAELTLSKVLVGAAAEEDWSTSAVFTVLVTCEYELADDVRVTLLSAEYDIVGGETITLTDDNGDPILVPFGARCFGDETNTGGATASVVSPDNYADGLVVTASDEVQTLALVATNTFEYGSLQLTKVVNGSGAAENSSKRFLLSVTCSLDQGQAEPTILFDNEIVEITGGETITVDNLPIGAECFAAETDAGGATSVAISHSTSSMPAVVSADEQAVITVTNTFQKPLPATGVDTQPLLIAAGVAAVLILGGVALMVVLRRRRRE